MQILDGVVHRNELNVNAQGGSELITDALASRVSPDALKDTQIIVSRLTDELLADKWKIYYCHDLPPDAEFLKNGGWRQFHQIVFVSNWQKQLFIQAFGIPWHMCTVLRNAIDPIDINLEKKFTQKKETIDLVYHTTPHRGLRLLVPVVKQLRKTHPEINLHVYSSFKIYGWDDRDKQHEELFKEIEATDGMFLYDPLPNEDMKERLKDMDLFTYPSEWPETSCISLIEAMSAGLMCIHSDFGALAETSASWTCMYDFSEREEEHQHIFLHMLDSAVSMYKEMPSGLITRLRSQKSYTDMYYSWDLRKEEWNNFLNNIKNQPIDLPKPLLTGRKAVEPKSFNYKSG